MTQLFRPTSRAYAIPRLRWWKEVLLVLAFYILYSWVRNQFGSAAVGPDRALENADTIIDLEKAMGLYFEPDLQARFIDRTAFIQFWNLFYGTFHFVVTAGVLVYLYRRQPRRYPFWRTTGLATTGLALVGFASFPLMPPRLLGDCGDFGACIGGTGYIDTVTDVGGLWSFDSGTAQAISNQYAAMPSLHFAWSLWCWLAMRDHLRRRWSRVLMAAYPIATLFAIVVTANHYWIDAVGGVAVLVCGALLARAVGAVANHRQRRQTGVASG